MTKTVINESPENNGPKAQNGIDDNLVKFLVFTPSCQVGESPVKVILNYFNCF